MPVPMKHRKAIIAVSFSSSRFGVHYQLVHEGMVERTAGNKLEPGLA